MKILLFSIVAVAALVSRAAAQTPIGPDDIKLGKVMPAVVKTPEYQIINGPQKRSTPGNWLEVEVEFATMRENIEELSFKYTLLIEGKLLDGEVTHVNIPAGREHYSVMYVAPRTLLNLTGGRPLTGASIQNAWVTVTKQGQALAIASYKPPLQIPNLPHIGGLVLNKGETPFAPLFFDRYEAIKVK